MAPTVSWGEGGGGRGRGGRGGGRSGNRERRRREGFWRVPFEDPLWNFKKRGGARPLRPPPPESASAHCPEWTCLRLEAETLVIEWVLGDVSLTQ